MANALDLPPDRQAAYVAQQSPEIRAELESLLAASRRCGGFLEQGCGPALPLDGRRIGPYKLIQEIGRGGMGTVYRAERDDGQFQKVVAVKVAPAAIGSPHMMSRFHAEQNVLAALEHPNIARLLDAGLSGDGLPYIVMEQVEGMPIDEYCRTHDVSTVDRLRLFREICSAVQYAHQHLFVHCDLKPSNILVSAEGTTKLLDFGIAQILGPFLDRREFAAGAFWHPMTPDYASPEQLRGAAVTTASDIYSMGVLLFQVLTGYCPHHFSAGSLEEAARRIGNCPPKMGSVAPDSADLDAIVAKAMQLEPADRYGSAEELSNDVGRYLAGLPVLARRSSWRYVAGKFVRRNRIRVAAMFVLALLAATGIMAVMRQSHIAERERAQAQRRFDDLHRLANYVLFDLNGQISGIVGTTGLRKQMVARAIEYLDSLAKESEGDVPLQMELALGYARTGDVQGGLGMANLHDASGALASYRNAERILSSVLAREPQRREARMNLARVRLSVSGVYLTLRNGPAAAASAREAQTVLEHMRAESPADPEVTEALGTAYFRLADSGSEDRVKYRLKVLGLLQQQPNTSSRKTSARLADIHRGLGSDFEAEGNMSDAIVHLRKALDIDMARVGANPVDRGASMALSLDYAEIGRWQFLQRKFAEALASDDRALEIRRALAEADPQDGAMRGLLAFAYLRSGQVLAEMGYAGEALNNYHRAVEISRDLVKAGEADSYYRGCLVQSYAAEAIAEAKLATAAKRASTRRSHSRASCSAYRRAVDNYASLKTAASASKEERDMIDRAAGAGALCVGGLTVRQ